MRVLDECVVKGRYEYRPTTIAIDGFDIDSADDLWARLPLGAAALETDLSKSGHLNLSYAVVGQRQASGFDAAATDLTGGCKSATHVVTGYAVGAFELSSGSSSEVKSSASIVGVGAGVGSSAKQSILRSGGEMKACREPGRAAARVKKGEAPPAPEPPKDCATPIQLFLAALPERAVAPTSAGAGTGRAEPSSEPVVDQGATEESPPKPLEPRPLSLEIGAGVLVPEKYHTQVFGSTGQPLEASVHYKPGPAATVALFYRASDVFSVGASAVGSLNSLFTEQHAGSPDEPAFWWGGAVNARVAAHLLRRVVGTAGVGVGAILGDFWSAGDDAAPTLPIDVGLLWDAQATRWGVLGSYRAAFAGDRPNTVLLLGTLQYDFSAD